MLFRDHILVAKLAEIELLKDIDSSYRVFFRSPTGVFYEVEDSYPTPQGLYLCELETQIMLTALYENCYLQIDDHLVKVNTDMPIEDNVLVVNESNGCSIKSLPGPDSNFHGSMFVREKDPDYDYYSK